MFALQNDGTVQAITSEGKTAWTADVSDAWLALPDFQGGLVAGSYDGRLRKLDGITGQPYPAYTPPGDFSICDFAVHTDGTIFVFQCAWDAPRTGIGNNAAHEIAHQYFFDGDGMDDSSKNTYNGQGCVGDKAPWVYGKGPIQWEGITDQAWRRVLGVAK